MQSNSFIPVLSFSLLAAVCCQPGVAQEAVDDSYTLSASPYNAVYYWCDNHHMAAVQNPGEERPGNLYFEAAHPDKAQSVALSGAEGRQGGIQVMGCRDRQMLVLPKAQAGGPYLLPLGQPPQLLMQGGDSTYMAGSLSGKYIVAAAPRLADGKGYRAGKECAQSVHAGFRVLCWDVQGDTILALTRFVVQGYRWQDKVWVRQPGQDYHEIPNPQPHPQDEAGQPFNGQMVFLRDLDNKVIARLDNDPRYDIEGMSRTVANPAENMLYAPCKRRNKSRFSADFDKVCRYRLDGAAHGWEEVFSFPLADQIKSGIQGISVDAAGSVYFDMPGTSGQNGGIWKFDAGLDKVVHIVAGKAHHYDDSPQVAADGKTLIFKRNSDTYFAYRKEAAQ